MNNTILNSANNLHQNQTNITSTTSNTAQEQIFNRVVQILSTNNLSIEGAGSFALDLEGNDKVKVIGNINNKEEIETALAADPEIITILKKELDIPENTDNNPLTQPNIDSLNISDQATAAYSEYKEIKPAVKDGYTIKDNSNPPSTKNNPSQAIIGRIKYSTIEKDKRSALISMLGLPDDLGDFESQKGLDNVKNALNNRIMSGMKELVTRTEEILLDQGIVLTEDEEMQFSVDDQGNILVTPNSEKYQDARRSSQIETALNSNREIQTELAEMLTALDLDERSLASMGRINISQELNGQVFLTDDQLLKDIAEHKYGKSLTELLDNGEELIADKSIYNTLKQINTKDLSTGSQPSEAAGITTGIYRISNSKIISNNTEDTVNEIWKPYTNNLNQLLSSEKTQYAPDDPDVLNLKNFVVDVDIDGKVDIVELKDRAGKNLTGYKKQLFMDKYMNCDIHDKSLTLQSLIGQTLLKHDYEHNDVEEYEHKVRISGSINSNMKYEVVSPEADEAAAKELNENLQIINEGLHKSFKSKGVLTPVEIKVNEYGKLEADTSTLSDNEQNIVDTVLSDINKEITKSYTEEEKEEEKKENTTNPDTENKTASEPAKELKTKELADSREDVKNHELYKLGRKTAEFNNIEYLKPVKNPLEKVSRLEKKLTEETGFDLNNNKPKTDPPQQIDGTNTNNAIQNSTLPSSLNGLEKIIELAKGLHDILDKFHSRDSMLAAIT